MQTPEKTYRLSTAAAVADAPVSTVKKWIDDEVLNLVAQQTGTWRAFGREDMLRLAAIAEVSRAGVDPKTNRAVWFQLVDALKAVDRDQPETRDGYYAIGVLLGPVDLFDDRAPHWNAVRCPKKDLTKTFAEFTPTPATWLVIDAVALLARFNKRLAQASRGEE